jgi:hypothetical protein
VTRPGFIAKALVVLLLYYIMIICFKNMGQENLISKFDPYEILEVDVGATT